MNIVVIVKKLNFKENINQIKLKGNYLKLEYQILGVSTFLMEVIKN